MDYFTSCPADVWTKPYSTWFAGTHAQGITENNVGSSSASTTDGSGRSTAFNDSIGRTFHESNVRDGTGFSSTSAQTSFFSVQRASNYTPSTHTEFVPSAGTVPASTITVTDDTTLTTSNRTAGQTINSHLSGDTTLQTQGTSLASTTFGTSNTSGSTTTAITSILTALAAPTGIGSSVGPLGFPTVTTTATQLGGWNLAGTSTSSISYVSTTWNSYARTTTTPPGTRSSRSSTTYSSSTWTTTASIATFTSSQTVSENTTATITYSADFRSTSTTTLIFGTTFTVGHSTATTTNHAWSPLENTVFLMNGNRNGDDYNLGNQLWVFSLGSLNATASTAGRFTDLFSSVSSATRTLFDYQKFTTSSVGITAITVSNNTTATTSWTVTGFTAGTGTNPDTVHTASTNVTVSTTWKNGATWDSYSHYVSGTSHLISAAASNYSTATLTFSLGDVSTSLHTETVGSPVSTISTTHFFGTYQETGYTDSGWTSTTSTMIFAASSTTESRLALHSPATTTQMIDARSTTTDETLISKFSSVGTDWHFVGLSKTTTTRVFTAPVSTTLSVWLNELNPEVDNYTTNSFFTFSPNGSVATNYSVSEARAITYQTENRRLPNTWSNPYESWTSFFTGLDNAWHRGPAFGYGGPGGDFTQSSLPVYLSVSIGLAGGGAFGTQTLETGNLPTALAYSGVTFFPDRTDYPIALPAGAARAKYISRISSLGQTASVGVTWTTTTASGTSTITRSTAATYTVAGVSSISGSFYRELPLTFNTSDIRGGAPFRGGYALGANALASDYTVRIDGGFVAWTAFSSDSSVSSGSSSSTAGSVTFTVPASLAIVLSVEPIISMSWGGDRGDHFRSSVPYFPT